MRWAVRYRVTSSATVGWSPVLARCTSQTATASGAAMRTAASGMPSQIGSARPVHLVAAPALLHS